MAFSQSGHTGAMIALLVPDPETFAINPQQGDSLPADELHITLAYLGEAAELSQEQKDAVLDACQVLADTSQSPEALFPATSGVFPPDPESSDDVPKAPYYAAPSNPERFNDLREDLLVHLASRGVGDLVSAKHPVFNPHVTLTYAPLDSPPDLSHLPTPLPTKFHTLVAKFGDEVHEFELTQPDLGPELPLTASVRAEIDDLARTQDVSREYVTALYLSQRQVRSTPACTRARAAMDVARASILPNYESDPYARVKQLTSRVHLEPDPAGKAFIAARALSLAARTAVPQNPTQARELAALTASLQALVADGNSSAARSLRARKQLRDRYGRWIEQGGGVRFKIRVPGAPGGGEWKHGIVQGFDMAAKRVLVKLEDGRTVKIPNDKIEQPKAILGLDIGAKLKSFIPKSRDRVTDVTSPKHKAKLENQAKQKELDDAAVEAMGRLKDQMQPSAFKSEKGEILPVDVTGGHISKYADDAGVRAAIADADAAGEDTITAKGKVAPFSIEPATANVDDIKAVQAAIDARAERMLPEDYDSLPADQQAKAMSSAHGKSLAHVGGLWNDSDDKDASELRKAPSVGTEKDLEEVGPDEVVPGPEDLTHKEIVEATGDALAELQDRVSEDSPLRKHVDRIEKSLTSATKRLNDGDDSFETYLDNLDKIKEYANKQEPAKKNASAEAQAFGSFAEDIDDIHAAAGGTDKFGDVQQLIDSVESAIDSESSAQGDDGPVGMTPALEDLKQAADSIQSQIDSGDYLEDPEKFSAALDTLRTAVDDANLSEDLLEEISPKLDQVQKGTSPDVADSETDSEEPSADDAYKSPVGSSSEAEDAEIKELKRVADSSWSSPGERMAAEKALREKGYHRFGKYGTWRKTNKPPKNTGNSMSLPKFDKPFSEMSDEELAQARKDILRAKSYRSNTNKPVSKALQELDRQLNDELKKRGTTSGAPQKLEPHQMSKEELEAEKKALEQKISGDDSPQSLGPALDRLAKVEAALDARKRGTPPSKPKSETEPAPSVQPSLPPPPEKVSVPDPVDVPEPDVEVPGDPEDYTDAPEGATDDEKAAWEAFSELTGILQDLTVDPETGKSIREKLPEYVQNVLTDLEDNLGEWYAGAVDNDMDSIEDTAGNIEFNGADLAQLLKQEEDTNDFGDGIEAAVNKLVAATDKLTGAKENPPASKDSTGTGTLAEDIGIDQFGDIYADLATIHDEVNAADSDFKDQVAAWGNNVANIGKELDQGKITHTEAAEALGNVTDEMFVALNNEPAAQDQEDDLTAVMDAVESVKSALQSLDDLPDPETSNEEVSEEDQAPADELLTPWGNTPNLDKWLTVAMQNSPTPDMVEGIAPEVLDEYNAFEEAIDAIGNHEGDDPIEAIKDATNAGNVYHSALEKLASGSSGDKASFAHGELERTENAVASLVDAAEGDGFTDVEPGKVVPTESNQAIISQLTDQGSPIAKVLADYLQGKVDAGEPLTDEDYAAIKGLIDFVTPAESNSEEDTADFINVSDALDPENAGPVEAPEVPAGTEDKWEGDLPAVGDSVLIDGKIKTVKQVDPEWDNGAGGILYQDDNGEESWIGVHDGGVEKISAPPEPEAPAAPESYNAPDAKDMSDALDDWAQQLSDHVATNGKAVADTPVEGDNWNPLSPAQQKNIADIATQLPEELQTPLEKALADHIAGDITDDALVQAISTTLLDIPFGSKLRTKLKGAQAGVQTNKTPLVPILRPKPEAYKKGKTFTDEELSLPTPGQVKGTINAIIQQAAAGADLKDLTGGDGSSDAQVKQDIEDAETLLKQALDSFNGGDVQGMVDSMRAALEKYDNAIATRLQIHPHDKIIRRLRARRRSLDETLAPFEGRWADDTNGGAYQKYSGGFNYDVNMSQKDRDGNDVYPGDQVERVYKNVKGQIGWVLGWRGNDKIGYQGHLWLDQEKKDRPQGITAKGFILSAVGPNNPLYHDPSYTGPRVDDDNMKNIEAIHADKVEKEKKKAEKLAKADDTSSSTPTPVPGVPNIDDEDEGDVPDDSEDEEESFTSGVIKGFEQHASASYASTTRDGAVQFFEGTANGKHLRVETSDGKSFQYIIRDNDGFEFSTEDRGVAEKAILSKDLPAFAGETVPPATNTDADNLAGKPDLIEQLKGLPVGSKIEVESDEPGYPGTWTKTDEGWTHPNGDGVVVQHFNDDSITSLKVTYDPDAPEEDDAPSEPKIVSIGQAETEEQLDEYENYVKTHSTMSESAKQKELNLIALKRKLLFGPSGGTADPDVPQDVPGEEPDSAITVGTDLRQLPDFVAALDSLPVGTKAVGSYELIDDVEFTKVDGGWQYDTGIGPSLIPSELLQNTAVQSLVVKSIPGDDDNGDGGGEPPAPEAPTAPSGGAALSVGDDIFKDGDQELNGDQAIARLNSLPEGAQLQATFLVTGNTIDLTKNEKGNYAFTLNGDDHTSSAAAIAGSEFESLVITSLPDGDTDIPSTGAFTPLPKGEQGASGDGHVKMPSGKTYWGKYGAAGIAITATDPETGEKKVLIGKKGSTGQWYLPGGALEEKETPQQGAAREFFEESSSGLTDLNALNHVGEHVYEDGTWKYTTFVAEADAPFDVAPTTTDKNSKELVEFMWASADDLKKLEADGKLLKYLAGDRLAEKVGFLGDPEPSGPDELPEDVVPETPDVDPTADTPNISAVTPPATYDMSGWKKVAGKQGGSSPGMVMEDEDGNRYYAKQMPTEDHIHAEVLASTLYKLFGINAADVRPGQDASGKMYVVSKWVPNKTNAMNKFSEGDEEWIKAVQQGFAIDAWLANYDVVGGNWDNLVTDEDGKPFRMDNGSSFMYKAMGGNKSWWGDEVTDLDDMRTDSWKNKSLSYAYGPTATMFGGMTDEDVRDSAKQLLLISPDEIKAVVNASGMSDEKKTELAETLIKRRHDILAKTGLLKGVSDGNTPENASKAVDDNLSALNDAKKIDNAGKSPMTSKNGVELTIGQQVTGFKGLQGEVVKVEKGGKFVHVKDADGKVKRRLPHTLTVVSDLQTPDAGSTAPEETADPLFFSNGHAFKVGDSVAFFDPTAQEWKTGELVDQDPPQVMSSGHANADIQVDGEGPWSVKTSDIVTPEAMEQALAGQNAEPVNSLGAGYADLPEGAVPLYKSPFNIVVQHSDGSLNVYTKKGDVEKAHSQKMVSYENSPYYTAFTPDDFATTAPEAPTAPSMPSLGEGFAQPPAGSKVLFKYKPMHENSLGVFLVEQPDGSLVLYYSDGDTLGAGVETPAAYENDPNWDKIEGDISIGGPAAGTVGLPPGFTPLKPGEKPLFVNVMGDPHAIIVQKADGSLELYSAEGTVIKPQAQDPEMYKNSTSWKDYSGEDAVSAPAPAPAPAPSTGPLSSQGVPIEIGDIVSNIGGTKRGEVVGFMPNGKVKFLIHGEDGKPLMSSAGKPRTSAYSPDSLKHISKKPGGAGATPPGAPQLIYTEPDTSHPLYGTEKPTPPDPQLAEVNFVDDDWMAQADAEYKERQAKKHPGDPVKDIKDSSLYPRYVNVQKYGSESDLKWLLDGEYISQETYGSALVSIEAAKDVKAAAVANFEAQLDEFNKQLIDWQKAHGHPILKLSGPDYGWKTSRQQAKAWMNQNMQPQLTPAEKSAADNQKGSGGWKSALYNHNKDIALDDDSIKAVLDATGSQYAWETYKGIKSGAQKTPLKRAMWAIRTLPSSAFHRKDGTKFGHKDPGLQSIIGTIQKDPASAEMTPGHTEHGGYPGMDIGGGDVVMDILMPEGMPVIWTGGGGFFAGQEHGMLPGGAIGYYIHDVIPEYKFSKTKGGTFKFRWRVIAEAVPAEFVGELDNLAGTQYDPPVAGPNALIEGGVVPSTYSGLTGATGDALTAPTGGTNV